MLTSIRPARDPYDATAAVATGRKGGMSSQRSAYSSFASVPSIKVSKRLTFMVSMGSKPDASTILTHNERSALINTTPRAERHYFALLGKPEIMDAVRTLCLDNS